MITEDIIKQAINESIDEFMLEEGLKDWYNNGNGKYLKNAVNWGKNAIANYMDKRTNGEWNRKYNVYADNTGKSIRSKNKWDYYRDLYAEQNCLKEWFDSHAEYLNKILHYKEGPMRSMYGRNNFFNTNVFMGISGGTQYIQAYCTYDNFIEYAQRYFTDYQGNEFIEKYINNQIQPLADVPQKCITKLNIRSFSSSPEGDGFYNQGMDERNAYLDKRAQAQQQKQTANQQQQSKQQQKNDVNTQIKELSNIKSLIPAWNATFAKTFTLKKGTPEYGNWIRTYNSFQHNAAIPENMKKFVISYVNYAVKNNDTKLLINNMTYNRFIKAYGSYYNKNAIKTVNGMNI